MAKNLRKGIKRLHSGSEDPIDLLASEFAEEDLLAGPIDASLMENYFFADEIKKLLTAQIIRREGEEGPYELTEWGRKALRRRNAMASDAKLEEDLSVKEELKEE